MEAVLAAAQASKMYSNLNLSADAAETLVVTKADFEEGLRDTQEDMRGVVWCTSGGQATSKKHYLPVATQEWREETAQMATLAKELETFTPSQTTVNLLTGTSYPLYDAVQRIMEDCGATLLPCDARSSDDYIVKVARRFKANTIVATTNRLARLAFHLQCEGATLAVKHIIIYGNFPHATQTRVFERVFGSEMHGKLFPPAYAAVYGTSELGVLGFSPAALHDSHLFITSPSTTEFTLKPCVPSELPPSTMEGTREVYENQRKYPMVGFKGKLMKKDPPPWTDADLKAKKRSEVGLPDVEEHGVWGFSGEWKVAPRWSYAWDWCGPWMDEDDLIASGSPNGGKREKPKIRRRAWKIKIVRTQSPEERGSGRVLATQLLRHKVPYLRYDTGDVAKPVPNAGITFRGERHTAIRIICRQHQSFHIGEATIFLSELEPLLMNFLDYQVIHDTKQDEGGSRDVLLIKVVNEGAKGQRAGAVRDVDAETKKRLAMDIREVIRQSRRDKEIPEYLIEISSVLPADLKLCDSSMKLRRLIDVRGNGGVPQIVRTKSAASNLNAHSPGSGGATLAEQGLQLKPPSIDGMSAAASSVCGNSASPYSPGGDSDSDREDEG